MDLRVFDTPQALAQAAAGLVAARAREAVAAAGRFSLVLSGGSSPLPLYRLLGADPDFPWPACHLFWGDERCVPAEHPESNRGAALKALGPPPGLPSDNLHPIRGQLAPQEAAQDYQWRLRGFFVGQDWPAWDLVLLGLGPDGHTASLFPGSPVLAEARAWAAAVPAPTHIGPYLPRVTLTLPAINSARCVLFLAPGQAKRPVLQRILDDPQAAAQDYPAARVRAGGETMWLVDRAAAPD
ncbi:MAG: 6-phosphogluconolactonase [Desulfarculus sp.]|nr:MAG: 6-phosphogluconolactonase [Desulfarculus sp.]